MALNAPIRRPRPRALSARATLAKNLVRLRARQGWSQERLALEAGLHRTFITHVEQVRRNLSVDNLEKLAIALSVEPYELLRPITKSSVED